MIKYDSSPIIVNLEVRYGLYYERIGAEVPETK